jgi:hypothetical protein
MRNGAVPVTAWLLYARVGVEVMSVGGMGEIECWYRPASGIAKIIADSWGVYAGEGSSASMRTIITAREK